MILTGKSTKQNITTGIIITILIVFNLSQGNYPFAALLFIVGILTIIFQGKINTIIKNNTGFDFGPSELKYKSGIVMGGFFVLVAFLAPLLAILDGETFDPEEYYQFYIMGGFLLIGLIIIYFNYKGLKKLNKSLENNFVKS